MSSKDTAIGIGSAGSVGASGSPAAGHAAGEEIQRWTAGGKAAVLLDLTKGKTTPADAARADGR